MLARCNLSSATQNCQRLKLQHYLAFDITRCEAFATYSIRFVVIDNRVVHYSQKHIIPRSCNTSDLILRRIRNNQSECKPQHYLQRKHDNTQNTGAAIRSPSPAALLPKMRLLFRMRMITSLSPYTKPPSPVARLFDTLALSCSSIVISSSAQPIPPVWSKKQTMGQ